MWLLYLFILPATWALLPAPLPPIHLLEETDDISLLFNIDGSPNEEFQLGLSEGSGQDEPEPPESIQRKPIQLDSRGAPSAVPTLEVMKDILAIRKAELEFPEENFSIISVSDSLSRLTAAIAASTKASTTTTSAPLTEQPTKETTTIPSNILGTPTFMTSTSAETTRTTPATTTTRFVRPSTTGFDPAALDDEYYDDDLNKFGTANGRDPVQQAISSTMTSPSTERSTTTSPPTTTKTTTPPTTTTTPPPPPPPTTTQPTTRRKQTTTRITTTTTPKLSLSTTAPLNIHRTTLSLTGAHRRPLRVRTKLLRRKLKRLRTAIKKTEDDLRSIAFSAKTKPTRLQNGSTDARQKLLKSSKFQMTQHQPKHIQQRRRKIKKHRRRQWGVSHAIGSHKRPQSIRTNKIIKPTAQIHKLQPPRSNLVKLKVRRPTLRLIRLRKAKHRKLLRQRHRLLNHRRRIIDKLHQPKKRSGETKKQVVQRA